MMNSWLGKTLPIAALFAFRMLGLFMLIPVFTVYASQLTGATPLLMGIALGAYGLTQGLLQIPFGILSDRYGRKPLIALGFLLFASGSLLGALTHSIVGMILARTLQGAGAIGSVLIALLSDVTSEQDRTKAMAIIGVTIGLSFSLALALSPSITQLVGLTGLFYLTTVLALLGLVILHIAIPNPSKLGSHSTINKHQLKQVFFDRDLQRLDAGIFFQHLILVSTFFAVPLIVQHHIKLEHLSQSWHFYLPLMISSFICMVPFILFAEKKGKIKALFLGAICTIIIAQIGLLWLSETFTSFYILMFVYFVAFNLLEASLPSLISKQANPLTKGCAMGIYSSSQFLGIFVGGSLSGLIFQYAGSSGIFILNSCIGLIWLGITFSLKITLSEPRP